MTTREGLSQVWKVACVVACPVGFALGGVVGCAAGLAVAVIGPVLFIIGKNSLRKQRLVRRFRRDFEGRRLPVCSRRGHWGQFIDNNVLPVLPEKVCVVWVGTRGAVRYMDDYPASALRALSLGNVVERPYLIRFVSRQPEIHRLHESLVG